MSVRWDAVANEWIDTHARGASPATRESLRLLFVAVRAGAHKEAVTEAAALDAEVAEQLAAILETLRG